DLLQALARELEGPRLRRLEELVEGKGQAELAQAAVAQLSLAQQQLGHRPAVAVAQHEASGRFGAGERLPQLGEPERLEVSGEAGGGSRSGCGGRCCRYVELGQRRRLAPGGESRRSRLPEGLGGEASRDVLEGGVDGVAAGRLQGAQEVMRPE